MLYQKIETLNPDHIFIVMGHGRTSGLSTHPASLAYILTVAIPFALFMISQYRTRRRLSTILKNAVSSFIMAIFLIVVISNGSRALLLGLIAGGIVFCVFFASFFPASLRMNLCYILLASIILSILFFTSKPTLQDEQAKQKSITTILEYVTRTSNLDKRNKDILKNFLTKDTHHYIKSQSRFFKFQWSAWLRIPISMTAIRYSLEFPLGTGIYSPKSRHLSRGLDQRDVESILSIHPHNQFLTTLVRYGFPGLILVILLYFYACRSLIISYQLAKQSRNPAVLLLVASIAVALTAYLTNSLFHASGAFTGSWRHFFLIGLVFSTERLFQSDSIGGRNR